MCLSPVSYPGWGSEDEMDSEELPACLCLLTREMVGKEVEGGGGTGQERGGRKGEG